jgi:FSR family fosmidomycin resistance protein-like MFS transporter
MLTAPDTRGLSILGFSHLADDLNQSFLPALLPFLVLSRGYTNEAAAFLVLAANLASSVVQPGIGYLADRKSIPWMIPIGMVLAGLGIALVAVAPSYDATLLAVGLSGIGVAAFHPEAARYANYLAGPRKATGMAYFTVGGNAGFAIGPAYATLVVTAFGIGGVGLALVPVVIMAVVLTRELPRMRSFAPKKGAARALGGVDDWGGFGVLTVVVVIRSTVYLGLVSFTPLFVVRVLHGSAALADATLTVLLICGAIGTIVGGRLTDRIGRKAMLVGSTGLTVATVLLFTFVTTHGGGIVGAFVVAAVIGFVIVSSQTAFVVLGQEYLPQHMGIASGVTLGLAITIGGAVAPILGHIGDLYTLVGTFEVIAGLSAVTALLALFLPPVKKLPPPAVVA